MAEKHLLKTHTHLVVVECSFTQVFCHSTPTWILVITKIHSSFYYGNWGWFLSFEHCNGSQWEENKERNFFSVNSEIVGNV